MSDESSAGEGASVTIGELAEQAGVTAEAVRYYEREGVIPPARRGGAGRYRRYTGADVQRVRFIRRARDLGFSLDEVRGLLGLAEGALDAPCADVMRIARAHLAEVDLKLRQLGQLRTELARIVEACDDSAPIAECRVLGALSGTNGGVAPHSPDGR